MSTEDMRLNRRPARNFLSKKSPKTAPGTEWGKNLACLTLANAKRIFTNFALIK